MRQKETAVIPIPRRMEITAVLCFQSRHCKLPFCSLRTVCVGNMRMSRGAQHPCWHTIFRRKV